METHSSDSSTGCSEMKKVLDKLANTYLKAEEQEALRRVKLLVEWYERMMEEVK